MSTDTPPRRKWHIARWLFVLALLTMAWGGWREYTFRVAISQAEELGWRVEHPKMVDTIRGDWKAALKNGTWLDGVKHVGILTSEEFENHLAIVHRLDPKRLTISNATTLRDLASLKPLSRLRWVELNECPLLTDVDALKNLSALQWVYLTGCTGLTKESVAALKAALPNATIIGP